MGLRVFILDDDPIRHGLFREWLVEARGVSNFDITTTWTAKEAIHALENYGPFHLIFLDHDLGGLSTGQEVADWLAANHTHFLGVGRPKVVVHSWNHDGGRRMFNALADAGFEVDRAWFGPSLKGYFL